MIQQRLDSLILQCELLIVDLAITEPGCILAVDCRHAAMDHFRFIKGVMCR